MRSFLCRLLILTCMLRAAAALAADAPATQPVFPLVVRSVHLISYRIPRTHAFVTSKGTSDTCYGIFIQLTADDGHGRTIHALGDALPRGLVTNETIADAWAGATAMDAWLVGKQINGVDKTADIATVQGWLAQLDHLANQQTLTTSKPPPPGKQLRATLCGFDEALCDLLGQTYGVPVYDILGGRRRQDVAVSAMTFNADVGADQLGDEVDDTTSAYGSIRLKIGLDADADIDKLKMVAEHLVDKPTVSIWVDANQAWQTSAKAIEMLGRVRDALKAANFKSTFICEQPTAGPDMPALAATTAEVHRWLPGLGFKIVIMADEAVWTLDDAKAAVAQHACDLINIKIQKCGGLMAAKAIGDYLASADPGMGVYVGGVVATDVTSWANLQLCYALPRLDYATACIPRRSYKVNVASVPIEYRTGKIMRDPTGPGLGTGLDLDKLKGLIRRERTDPSTQPATAR